MTSSFLPITTLDILLFAFACLVLGLALLLFGRSLRGRKGLIVSFLVLALLLGSTLIALALRSSFPSWIPLAALTALWSAGLLVSQVRLYLISSCVHRLGGVNLLALILIGLGVGSPLAWSHWQEQQIQEHDANSALLAQIGAPRHNQVVRLGLTDRGRAIPLLELHADIDVAGWTAAENRKFAAMNLQHPPVRTALPNPDCNCHGWVFAGGGYWVDGNDVKNILDDNGYYEVAIPEVGDIIVYFAGNELLHSGVVRSVNADDGILIESKWGMNSRVLHAPEDQPLWQNWQFYHTSREGHQLRLPGKTSPNKSLLAANPCN